MLNNSRTVVVIGAGAGADFNMPLGSGLARTIENRLSVSRNDYGDPVYSDANIKDIVLNNKLMSGNELYLAAETISRGVSLSNSIDDFLNYHSEDANVVSLGKLAIVKSILEAEKASRLWSRDVDGINFARIYDSWAVKLFRIIGRGIRLNDENQEPLKNITFINFNYDRCLELFLANAIRNFHGFNKMDFQTAFDISQKVKIFHPYGTVGSVRSLQGDARFGDVESLSRRCRAALNDIKTYTERALDQNLVVKIKEAMKNCETLIFLGFAFHKQNMDLLRPVDGISSKNVFTTAFGVSEEDALVVRAKIASLYRNEMSRPLSRKTDRSIRILRDMPCDKFFDNYAMTFSS
jgi:hypothetical protein